MSKKPAWLDSLLRRFGDASRTPAPPPDEPLERLRAALVDRYAIEREIGRGGMATVYLAWDPRHKRQVAIKVLHPELAASVGADRFLREIRITASLQHPRILTLIDSGNAFGVLYYVMPYVDGRSLRQEMAERGRFDPEEAIRLTGAVASGLAYAHGLGVIHRDIKPENILLSHGEPVVADFGIARALRAVAGESVTATGAVIGTPSYMSPEQVRGEGEIDARSDIYSLGCVLFEMVAGSNPFPGQSAQAVMAKRLAGETPSLRERRPDAPEWLDAVVAKAMEPDRVRRFPDADAFAAALRRETPVRRVPGTSSGERLRVSQQIQFCTTKDGTKIAYAVAGEGPPLVKAANWLSHLEHDWESPIWRHWLTGLARRHRFVRYDERGCGLSDWDVEDFSVEAFVADLEAVIDSVGLDRFPLLGVSQGGAIAIHYALRHPEKVSRLILHGAYARGRRHRGTTEDARAEEATMLELVRLGWGKENPAFRRVFTTLFFPEASEEEARSFTELQRISSSPENALAIMKSFHGIDVRDLAPRITAPTLVLHCTGDARIPFEEGRLLAGLIPGARLTPLTSRNHIPLPHEPAWAVFLEAIQEFLDVDRGPASG